MFLEYIWCHSEPHSATCCSIHTGRITSTNVCRTLFDKHVNGDSESQSRHHLSRTINSSQSIPFQSVWLLIAICWVVISSVVANHIEVHPNDTARQGLARQLRHRLHLQQSLQNKRHHYYQHTHHHQHLHHHRVRSTSNKSSPSTIAPAYLLQQLVRQQQSSSRHRHPYYFYYEHDNSTSTSTELNPIHNQTYMRWSSRQTSARLLQDRAPKVIYQLNGIQSDDQLPLCESWQVCNKVDTYSTPWIEKQCRCPAESSSCSQSVTSEDGHTIVEKTRQYKTCEPIRKLPTCRYFRDITWTITTTSVKSERALNSLLSSGSSQHYPSHQTSENITRQEVKCVCPPNSVAYIFKHQVYKAPDGQLGYRYHFACSPETKLRCKRKEPCRLFTARKRPRVEEVTTNTLCQCPGNYACPANHRHPSVLIGTVYPLDNIRTYSGYCYPDNSAEGENVGSGYLDGDSDKEESLASVQQGESATETHETDVKANSAHRSKASSEERTQLNSKYASQEEKYLLSLLR